MSTRLDVVAEARTWIGTPYLHQASVRSAGTDCLGLLRGVWRALSGREPETVPAYTMDWSEASGQEAMLAAARRWLVEKTGALEPGDILVFRMRPGFVAKHVGIVAGAGPVTTFIHAYTGHGVVENALSAPWTRRIAGHFEFPKGA
ncbi:MAG: peptidase [Rhodobacterales bacterium 17-64-5]|nr:MAG: peptidase [Rhodobacterales bacterium 17-64-5]